MFSVFISMRTSLMDERMCLLSSFSFSFVIDSSSACIAHELMHSLVLICVPVVNSSAVWGQFCVNYRNWKIRCARIDYIGRRHRRRRNKSIRIGNGLHVLQIHTCKHN